MTFKNNDNKNSINYKIGRVVIPILWMLLIFGVIAWAILWEKSGNAAYILCGVLTAAGALVNIYILSKAKSE